MSCPNCGHVKVISMRSTITPEGAQPMTCVKCKHFWDAAKQEPKREWRLNEADDGVYRLIEVLDGRLVSVGLQYKTENDGEEAPISEVRRQAKFELMRALQGMIVALDKPVLLIKQVLEEVGKEGG